MENVFLSDKDVVNIFKNHLKIESRVVPIEDLFNLRNLSKIDYSPYYQRKYVWNNEKATYFIESILIGTEVPPLIFFHGESNAEIIDGRQRFETIKNFIDNKFNLNIKGLMNLKSLNKKSFSKLNSDLKNRFFETKIRVIDFRLINEPKLDYHKEDLIKKEIFRRYNSGITPLKRAEVDKAVFIDDPLTSEMRLKFQKDINFYETAVKLFFPKRKNLQSKALIEDLLSKIRLLVVLDQIPIKYYSTLSNRKDIMNMFYLKFSSEIENLNLFISNLEFKIKLIDKINSNIGVENGLISECLFWSLEVIENENFNLKNLIDDNFILYLSDEIRNNLENYSEENSHFSKEFNTRYKYTLSLFETKLGINLKTYIDSYNSKSVRENIDLEKENQKEEFIENLFWTKPEPSSITIESIINKMQKDNFRVRPIYQRSEVMNIDKASSLIESILLEIKLPPIFVYKNTQGVYEVVDGQQRILSIVGFLGAKYKDEFGNFLFANKNNFKLRNLTIFKELEGKNFKELDEVYKDKIWDFNLSLVEIDSKINENFNPIDLFIRLNSKPYPIRENTFEMWNSYVDIDIVKKIKENTKKIENWFYIKKPKNNKRMENEELYTTLAYIDYKLNFKKEPLRKIVNIHKREYRINCRISNRKEISKVLNISTQSEIEKNNFLNSVKNVDSFIQKLKTILIRENVQKEDLDSYLDGKLEEIFNLIARRRLHNFFFLYPILVDINLEMIKKNRDEIFTEIQVIYEKISKLDENESEEVYFQMINQFKDKYSSFKRKINLSDEQKKNILEAQNNICSICNNLLFLGDSIEIDHIKPISLGGNDSIENLQLVHKDCNRKKGSKTNFKTYEEELKSLSYYLSLEEDENLEFKSTLTWNIKGDLKDSNIENSVLKTIAAFNNSEGGILLIGVDDDKNILGLENDFNKSNLKDTDKFLLHFNNILRERLVVDTWYLSKNIKTKFLHSENNEIVCVIQVNKGKKPIYTKDEKFYIRAGNSTIQLGINEIYEYVKNNFDI